MRNQSTARHRTSRKPIGQPARWVVIVVTALMFGGIAATATSSAAEQPHGHYTVITHERTPANQAAFSKCWGDNAGITDAQWDELSSSRTEADVTRFYAEHPQVRAAFQHCLTAVPRVEQTTTTVVTY
ncbi:hypothetical protein [Labedaea rhizosphaerae]|uniref:Uncharacterized protein n=1 Tax=Labedaea rhizosphaerae TaxID=598644 RepID=A0A4V3CZD9_LABRH|nr:hypothetical protein [Labedaea rhizosphaerae]TDP97678.1 hypothetical protein EV186_103642 [Labedaea rhizosphaerae]